MSFLIKNRLIFFVLFFGLFFFTSVQAQFTSTNFQLENPVNIIEGGQSSSSSFQYFSSTGQLESGQSTSGSFAQNAGFLYFPSVISGGVSATAGDAQVTLNWSVPATFWGFAVGSYEVGTGTTSGSYTFQNVGNVNTFIKTGLSNGTTYYFKIKAKTADSAFLVFSNEASTIPVHVTSTTTINSINPTQIASESLNSSEGTTATVNIPANTLASGDTYKMSLYSFPKTEVSTALPVPSGKVAASTMYNFSVYKESDLTQISSFTQPVTINVSYTDADVSGLVESGLQLYSWDGSQWSALNSQVLDIVHNTISGTTTHFSNFAILSTPVVSPPTPTPSPSPAPSGGGGGGGGGGNGNPPASSSTTTFSGRAYPNSTVVLLKDAQVLTSTVAGNDANFTISVNSLSAGSYVFSVYSEDNQGNRSSLLTFPVSITAGASTNIGGIFLAPTISADKSQVKKGDNITFFGQSIPKSQITIAIHSTQPIFEKTNTDNNGVYLQVVDSSPLDLGDHTAMSKAARDEQISSDSNAIAFAVGDKNIVMEKKKIVSIKADLNGDGKVNLIDFSVEAFWYKKQNPPAKVDLNHDGVVNLVDFSIMAYYWTG